MIYFNHMKRLFTVAVAALAFGLAAMAQGLPKTEFQIIGFGGKAGINYTVDKANFEPKIDGNSDFKSMDFSKPMDLPWGYGGGIGFVWNFAPHWGLLTGLEASYYEGQVKVGPDDVLLSAKWGVDDQGNIYDYINGIGMNDFQETQKVWMAQLPIMLQYNAALNSRQSIHWYIAAGAKLAYGVKATYSSKTSFAYAYYADSWGTGVTAGQAFQDGDPLTYQMGAVDMDGYDQKSQKLEIRQLNGFASLETGFRWKLGESVGLYTGIYCDYGLLSLTKGKKEGKFVKKSETNITPTQQSLEVKEVQSILNAQQADYGRWRTTGGLYTPGPMFETNDKSATKGPQNLVSAGLKIRLSFGRHSPKVAPAPVPVEPQIIYVPQKADTVTVEKIVVQKDTVTVTNTVTVKDTVTVEKVVRDTVIIIKEVPVEIQKVMKDLSNTLFKFNKFNLGETEKGYLDQVADWIKSEPEINVEIGGHTDSVGSDSYNQKLSEQRAKAVCDYLISQGVDKARLTYKGYGESEPIATNETEAGRQRNRRVELKILQ